MSRASTSLPPTLVTTIATPDGPFTFLRDGQDRVIATGWNTGVPRLLALLHKDLRAEVDELVEAPGGFAAEAVEAYYDGELDAIGAVPVREKGTPMQEAGWRTLCEIPAGQALSYSAFAARFTRPLAVRAAASVCARNPVALFVPCHRVLRADGSLGGFGWGLEVKRSLLEREGVVLD
ncbi:methylated-DNA--[protein]-cysteine S-methyltransferase [Schaalia sp. 19OD2882]|uniref:methylated-DNA--[protein]-cysteine S-methyltransferase n=1 Tax=Schaalia sp. 19OD2882 TaxID=2794089 RepID=UPI001C1EC604|nr:methylated-DNA--[protein]-cysteine S-methyltransferase [Schaalia sp. 19OD2882]QWW19031.1 methylated-DNA--[protein]-cysteine S-methyltransferase [Schaalia sp. 19OD2882]